MSVHVAATTPYPWPYDGDLDGGGTALLVVAPTGTTVLPRDVREVVAALAAAVRRCGGLVVVAATASGQRTGDLLAPVPPWTAATPGALPDGLVPSGRLGPSGPDEAVVAGGIDAFYASPLDLLLRSHGIERLLIAGVGLETCIHSTMRDANDRGYECLLVLDACVPIDPELVPGAVSMIEMSGGIFGAVGRSHDVLAALTYQGALT